MGAFPAQIYELLNLKRFPQLAMKVLTYLQPGIGAAFYTIWGVPLLSELFLTFIDLG